MYEDDLSLFESGDGSHSLYSDKFQDSYHSTHGAVRESKLIYIDYGLRYISKSRNTINLLELGFGTGLNLMLTLNFANENPGISIRYETVEAFPVPMPMLQKLNYPEYGTEEDFLKMHDLPWNAENRLGPMKISKIHSKFEDLVLKVNAYDLIFFDAFAPSKQPHLWEESFVKLICTSLKKDGILVTYCSQGKFRRVLEGLGLSVEKLTGPPGKREVIRAIKN